MSTFVSHSAQRVLCLLPRDDVSTASGFSFGNSGGGAGGFSFGGQQQQQQQQQPQGEHAPLAQLSIPAEERTTSRAHRLGTSCSSSDASQALVQLWWVWRRSRRVVVCTCRRRHLTAFALWRRDISSSAKCAQACARRVQLWHSCCRHERRRRLDDARWDACEASLVRQHCASLDYTRCSCSCCTKSLWRRQRCSCCVDGTCVQRRAELVWCTACICSCVDLCTCLGACAGAFSIWQRAFLFHSDIATSLSTRVHSLAFRQRGANVWRTLALWRQATYDNTGGNARCCWRRLCSAQAVFLVWRRQTRCSLACAWCSLDLDFCTGRERASYRRRSESTQPAKAACIRRDWRWVELQPRQASRADQDVRRRWCR